LKKRTPGGGEKEGPDRRAPAMVKTGHYERTSKNAKADWRGASRNGPTVSGTPGGARVLVEQKGEGGEDAMAGYIK